MGCQKSLDFEAPPIAGAHLSYYWTMDEAGDANKLDSTVGQPWNTNAGTVSPPGLFVNGVQLDCTAPTHALNGPDSPAFAFNAATSKGISFWFWHKVTVLSPPGDANGTIFSMEMAATVPPNDSRLKLTIGTRSNEVPPYGVFIDHDDFTGGNNAETTPITFNTGLGVWHMFCGTLDLVAHTLNLYIDGALAATVADPYPFSTSDKGTLVLENVFFPPQLLTVICDEFGLSLTGALTPAQVLALYNGGAGVTWPGVKSIVPFP